MRSYLFWDVTQSRLVVIYRHCVTTYWSHLEGSSSPVVIYRRFGTTYRSNLPRVKQSGSYLSKFQDNLSVPSSRVKQFGSYLLTFRDNLSVPSSRVKQSKKIARPLKMGPTVCHETSELTTNLRYVTSQNRGDVIDAAAEAWYYPNGTSLYKIHTRRKR